MEEFSFGGSRGRTGESIVELEKANIPESREEKLECYRTCAEDPWEVKSEQVCHEACKF